MTPPPESRNIKRPVVGILVYGSLLSPEELDTLFDRWKTRTNPVTVQGFRRLFNQEASWRDTSKKRRGVLNVEVNKGHLINALLVEDLAKEEYRSFRNREKGYRMIEVSSEQIEPYVSGDCDISEQDIILISRGTNTNPEIRPIANYVETSLDGAQHWGNRFYEQFLKTTEIQYGEPLHEYVKSERIGI